MSSSTSNENAAQTKRALGNRWVLIAIAAICLAPVVLGTLAFYYFPTSGRTNYGDLLPPTPLAEAMLTRLDGSTISTTELKGTWVVVAIDGAACADACQKKLYYMRQTRTAQGKERERIRLLWVLSDTGTPDPKLLQVHPDLLTVRADAQWLKQFPAPADARDHIYMIDPLGNLMLRFPKDADPKKIIKDQTKLLKASRVG